jgi:hypothetical protein
MGAFKKLNQILFQTEKTHADELPRPFANPETGFQLGKPLAIAFSPRQKIDSRERPFLVGGGRRPLKKSGSHCLSLREMGPHPFLHGGEGSILPWGKDTKGLR